MESLLAILAAVLPVYLLMGLGGGAWRLGWFGQFGDQVLTRLAVNLFFPCLILDRVIGNERLKEAGSVAVAAGLGFGLVAGSMLLCLLAARAFGLRKGGGRRTFGLAAGLQNYGFVALPVIDALFSRETAGVMFVFNIGVELAMWTIGVGMLTGLRRAPLRLMLSPPLMAILFGLTLNFTGLDAWWPALLADTAYLAGQCAVPVALVAIGALLFNLLGRERTSWRTAGVGVAMRCALLPLLFLLPALVLPLSVDLQRVLVVQAAMPAAVFSLVLARLHGGHPQTAIEVIVATKVVSIVTTPLWIALGLHWLGLAPVG